MSDAPAPPRTPPADVLLGEREAAVLTSYLDRVLRWDRAAAVRLVTRPSALGCYAAPPMGVLAFLAVPTAAPIDDLDLTCSAVSLRAALDREPAADGSRALRLPPAIVGTAALADLPPADGWHLPIPGVSGDLVPLVDQAVAQYRSGVAADPSRAESLADETWEQPLWAGLPMRVLHCARLLGFLPADGSRVAAATAGQWKRLTTGRGQVFVRSGAAVGHLSLLPPL